MDNRRLDITSQGEAALAHAMALAWDNAAGSKTSHYRISKDSPTFVLYWSKPEEHQSALALPYPLKLDEAVALVAGWLRETMPSGPEPDHDGDNGKGWRVFNEAWGHVNGSQYGICAIQPVWAMYGK